ncbi:hypothetical protein BOX15_Mlig006877g1, partial [Macrostomum lignano]
NIIVYIDMDKALDGGWGWMIVLAVHFMHFLTGGLDRATGVFYREILYDMQESSASTAGFTALLFSSRFLSGACDTVSRFSLGLLFDTSRLVPHRRRIWTLGMLLTASSIAAFAFMHSLAPFVLVSVAFGLTSGLFVSQLYCVLGDLIGRERCRTGIGLLILCRGVGVAIGPPLAGAIKDISGSYKLSFCALGAATFAGFVCLCVLDVVLLLRGRRQRLSNPEATTVEIAT